jgi:hypothetical protein
MVSLKHSGFFFMWGDGRIHQVNDPKCEAPSSDPSRLSQLPYVEMKRIFVYYLSQI